MVCRRRLVVLFVFSRAPSLFWRLSLDILVVCILFRDTLLAEMQRRRCSLASSTIVLFVGLELVSVSAMTELAACFAAMLGRVWCGLTLVVSCPLLGFQPLHALLLAVATLMQLVLVGVFVLSFVRMVVRSLTSLAGYVQSKGESNSSFRQILVFVKWFSQALSFCFMETLVVSGFPHIWIVGERQLGSCITMFLSAASQRAGATASVCGFEYWNCFSSSGYGHVLRLRICASGELFIASCFAEAALMIGELKLMIAEAVTLVITAAAFSAFLGFLTLGCVFLCIFALVRDFSGSGGYKGPSFAAAASAAATPRVDVEKGPQAAAAPERIWWCRRRFPLAARLKSTPSFLTMLVKIVKKRSSVKVMGTLLCWYVGCRGTRLWSGVDRGGLLLICLLLFGVALLFLFIFFTWWWRGECLVIMSWCRAWAVIALSPCEGEFWVFRAYVSPIPGEWTCPGCMRSGCWPTKNTCFRCGTMRPNSPLPPGPVLSNSRPARAPREQRHPGRAPGVSPSGCPTERRTPPPHVSSAPSAPSVPAAAGLNLDVVVQFLRGLNVPSEILADIQKAVPPPAPKKTVHQLTKEQKCSQLRNKVDITKQQLSKLG